MIYSDLLASAAKNLRTSSVEIERIVISAPYRYKAYTIPKRNGGLREIHHPTPAVKAIQRWLVNEPLASLPVHEAVFSYRKGRNIAMHAAMHARSNFFARFDFSDFFPSIASGSIKKFLKNEVHEGRLDLENRAIEAVVRLVCRHKKETNGLVLSIGAPSSPHMSNAMLFAIDDFMTSAAQERGGVYTRYADDVYISASARSAVEDLSLVFRNNAEILFPYLKINDKKTQHLSRRRRITVTGINITSERQLSLGRELKRSIKTRAYLALEGHLAADEISSLRGMLAHAKSVEPRFLDSLANKFGVDRINKLLDLKSDLPAKRVE